VDVERLGAPPEVIPPDPVDDEVPREHDTRVRGEPFEQPELPSGQVDLGPPKPDTMRVDIDLEIANDESGL